MSSTNRPCGLVIAIDGPSGAGKSTLTRLLAHRIRYLHIDTGAMFRALALEVSRAGIDPDDEEALVRVCGAVDISFRRTNGDCSIISNGEDVSAAIRSPEISMLTSRISARKVVRDLLLELQRRMGKDGGVILEGRDIGTVVFPDAELKFFLTASHEQRGRRRFLELSAKGEKVTLEETVRDVVRRDEQDASREHAPLKKAEDAVEIDSTSLTVDEVLSLMERMVRERQHEIAPEKEVSRMKVTLAKRSGFCFGVKRATHMAFEAAEKEGKTYTLGPIIHSPQVVNRLEQLGVKVLQTLEGVENGTVIIRSHGVTSDELDEAVRKALEVVDATCPFVKKAQEHVRNLSQEGYEVIVVGDADHPEVQGIVSYAGDNVHVVGSGAEAKLLPRMPRIGVVAQTTQSFENLSEVVQECLLKGNEVRVFNTICDATAVRQEEAKKLAKQVDCMIVIGGYNSANTRRLAEICSELQPRTHHIETAQQLDVTWFYGVEHVGVTAGASTPKWLIDDVIETIELLDKEKKG